MSVSRHDAARGRGRIADRLARAGDAARRRQHDLPGILEAVLLLRMALGRTLGPPVGRLRGRASRLSVWLGLVLLVWDYLAANNALPTRPRSLGATDGWWAWYDQTKTLQAVMGFHQHAAAIANQWYQPLYPLLGALGMHLAPRQPFLWLDLAGLLVSFLLFVPLARLMGVGRPVAVLVFLLVDLGERTILDNWVIPWNTTPTTPLILLGMLCAGKLVRGTTSGVGARRGHGLIWPFGLGFAAGLIPAFRPTDLLTLVAAFLVVLVAIAAMRPGRWARHGRAISPRMVGVVIAGFAAGFGIFLASYLPIFGLHPSPYMLMSSQTGFEWRLLPMHWVTLVVGPRPLFPGQAGMVERFWWLAPCLAGAVSVVTAGAARRGPVRSGAMPSRLPEGRPIHVIVLGGIVPYWCLYLCYRDLHPPGLWRYNNFHYFMWSFPLLGVYGVRLAGFAGAALRDWWRHGTARAAGTALPVVVGVAVVAAGLCWRPQLGPWSPPAPAPRLDVGHGAVLIPGGLSNMHDALLVATEDTGGRLDFGEHRLDEGGRTFATFHAFRAFPISGGTMVLPLRPLPPGDGLLRFDGVALDPTVQPRLLRQDMVFGFPCWVPRIIRPTACLAVSPLPGPLFPQGHQIDFNSRMETAYLIPGGWSDHADGRWTLGYSSSLQFRVPDRAGLQGGIVVEVEGAGFIPRGSDGLVIDVTANGRTLTRWRVSTTDEVALRVSVPATLIPADGEVMLTLATLNARRPADTLAQSTDRRLLGFRVRAVRMLPWSEHQGDGGAP